MQFLVNGAVKFNEPGVFMAFEETGEELATNVHSLGFDVQGLVRKNKLNIDYVYIERSEIEETGEYDLEGLFLRLNYAIDSIKAKRVVLDTIEVLFAGLPNENIIRPNFADFQVAEAKRSHCHRNRRTGNNRAQPLRARGIRC